MLSLIEILKKTLDVLAAYNSANKAVWYAYLLFQIATQKSKYIEIFCIKLPNNMSV